MPKWYVPGCVVVSTKRKRQTQYNEERNVTKETLTGCANETPFSKARGKLCRPIMRFASKTSAALCDVCRAMPIIEKSGVVCKARSLVLE